MSEKEDPTGTVWDSPNQQVVRGDESAPWEEGGGGPAGSAPKTLPADNGDSVDLDGMTKDELLAYAQQLGVSPANAGMTKDELRAGVDAKEAES